MRTLPACLFAALLFATATAEAAEIIAPSNAATAQSVVTLPAGSDTVLVPGYSRRYLCVMNIGTGLVSLAFDQAATAGAGWALEPASATGHQGGSMCWESALVTGSAVHAISAAGSTVTVIEAR